MVGGSVTVLALLLVPLVYDVWRSWRLRRKEPLDG
jgi:hypothetical protein